MLCFCFSSTNWSLKVHCMRLFGFNWFCKKPIWAPNEPPKLCFILVPISSRYLNTRYFLIFWEYALFLSGYSLYIRAYIQFHSANSHVKFQSAYFMIIHSVNLFKDVQLYIIPCILQNSLVSFCVFSVYLTLGLILHINRRWQKNLQKKLFSTVYYSL